ncbi:MAG TPA: hypothetical protein DDY68_04900 [Porphyromonadaceae bacterium]|nr:hypothetical protein [Porphyromonadaceae bacterium]
MGTNYLTKMLLLGALATGSMMMGMTSCSDDDKENGSIPIGGEGIDSVRLNKSCMGLLKDYSEVLLCKVYPNNAVNKKVIWKSVDEGIASVDSEGKVTGLKAGSTIIRCTSEAGSKSDSCLVVVSVIPKAITKLTFSQPTLSGSPVELVKGVDSLFKVTIEPKEATNQFLNWSVDKEGIIGLNSLYVGVTNEVYVHAKDTGSVVLTISATDGSRVKSSCSIKVVKPGHRKRLIAKINGGDSVRYAIQLWDGGPYFAEFNVGATIGSYEGRTEKLSDCYNSSSNTNDTTVGGCHYCWGRTYDCKLANDYSFSSSTTSIAGIDSLDAARANWGAEWRMPTDVELSNFYPGLRMDTTWYDGVNKKYMNSSIAGMCFKGRGDYAKDSIFFPAAGQCGQINGFSIVGTEGRYWSSAPKGGLYWALNFSSGDAYVNLSGGVNGRPVRAVAK